MSSAETKRQAARNTNGTADVPPPSAPTIYVPANPPRAPKALIVPTAGAASPAGSSSEIKAKYGP
jgi:hypothetical protein